MALFLHLKDYTHFLSNMLDLLTKQSLCHLTLMMLYDRKLIKNLFQLIDVKLRCSLDDTFRISNLYRGLCGLSGTYHCDRPAGQGEGGYVHLDCCS